MEHNKVHDNYYGTHRDVVSSIVNSGKICILDIDIQGVRDSIKNGLIVSNRIFIIPPNIGVLKQRLLERGTETPESLQKRLDNAIKETETAFQSKLFHGVIKNDIRENFIKDSLDLVKKFYPFIK